MVRLGKFLFCAVFFCAIGMAAGSYAARDFARLSFTFDNPTQLRVAGSGNTLVLTFGAPVNESRETILRQAGSHATEVAIASDRKTITITMDAAYRTRQFLSGNKVGLDILTGEVTGEVTKDTPETKIDVEKQETPAAVEPAASSILTTKKTVNENSLSTKQPEPQTSAPTPPILEIPSPPIPAPEPTAEQVTIEPAPTPITVNEPVTEPAAEAILPTANEAAQASTASFLVTTKEIEGGLWINFPWEQRTAAAVFERAGDIWIVFSRPQTIELSLLKPLLPKSVITVEQFYSKTHTVLRIATDGTLNATARQPKGSYRWHIQLSQRQTLADTDVTITSQSDDGSNYYLLFGLFGSGNPLQFYDPRVGDLVMMIPTFEEGFGLSHARQFPSIEVHKTQQGIAITSARDDLTLNYSRIGLKLTGTSNLSVSHALPSLTAKAEPVISATGSANVLFPYEQWYIPPGDYVKTMTDRLRNAANATPAARPDAIASLAQLALTHGYMQEALGYLNLLRTQYPNYYAANQLAVLRAAANLFTNRIKEAEADIASSELEVTEELQLWRDAIGLYTPAIATHPVLDAESIAEQKTALSSVDIDANSLTLVSAPGVSAQAKPFDFVGYNKAFIRFYPPALRQKLAVLASEFYFKANEPEQAVAVFDTLNRDNIMKPVQLYAELALAKTAAKKSQTKEAFEILDRLSAQQEDRYIQAQARHTAAITKYRNGLLTGIEAAEELERIRMGWRSDALERQMLRDLADIYTESKQYDNTLRTWKYTLSSFPSDPDTLTIAGNMSDLFKTLFLGGEADTMEPLKALALFYEFRDLTPIGVEGDEMIQRLADRLASVDLLDRAAQLLDHQIRFRASGESRARIGARLALISLLNREPARALEVLQTTNYGSMPDDLRRERQQLMAQALSRTGKHEDALVMLYSDTSRAGNLLRLDILWAMQDWANIINQAEDILTTRLNLTDPLTEEETNVLLKLALAYNFESDYTQLGYLRDYYMALVQDSPLREILSFLTNDTAPIDASDSQVIAQQISNTEGFLSLFRNKIAQGKLSQAIAPIPETPAASAVAETPAKPENAPEATPASPAPTAQTP